MREFVRPSVRPSVTLFFYSRRRLFSTSEMDRKSQGALGGGEGAAKGVEGGDEGGLRWRRSVKEGEAYLRLGYQTSLISNPIQKWDAAANYKYGRGPPLHFFPFPLYHRLSVPSTFLHDLILSESWPRLSSPKSKHWSNFFIAKYFQQNPTEAGLLRKMIQRENSSLRLSFFSK